LKFDATREKTRLWLLLLIGVVATLLGQTHAREIFAPSSHESGIFATQTQASTGKIYDVCRYDAPDSLLAANNTTAIRPYFPANNGFLGATEKQFLVPGQTIDRFGGSGYSRFFSPAGTSEAARALPAGSAGQQLRSFEVMKPFPVDAGTVAPAFGQPGLGQQFVTPVRLETLLKRGILRESP